MEKIFRDMLVKPDKKVKLSERSTTDTGKYSKEESDLQLEGFRSELAELQEKLYAANNRSLLIIFQAMDAGGKDGAVKHVFSGVNPQGCQVVSFKQPSSVDYSHDFLWRHSKLLPQKGHIGIHNRSHYENVLICKVHPEYILKERMPRYQTIEDINSGFWKERYASIRDFEDHLSRNGTTVIKFFLNISKDEQKKRFMSRIDDYHKNWKFSSADIVERQYWDKYMEAYEDALSATSTKKNPWYIIPSDKKWFARLAIGKIIVQTLEDMKLEFSDLDKTEKEKLAGYKDRLEQE